MGRQGGHLMFRVLTFSARALVCGLFLLLPLVSANAQFRAGIQGTVTDSTGALVPDATVTLTNKETGAKQTTQSSGDGFYRISGLAPGRYSLVIEKTGFKKQSFENVVINAEDTQGIDVMLTTGEVAETVTVTAETAQAIETENGNRSEEHTSELQSPCKLVCRLLLEKKTDAYDVQQKYWRRYTRPAPLT